MVNLIELVWNSYIVERQLYLFQIAYFELSVGRLSK